MRRPANKNVLQALSSLSLALALLLPLASAASHGIPPMAVVQPVVNCLLPGQIRRLNRDVTYVTRPRLVRIAADDCRLRGGRYRLY